MKKFLFGGASLFAILAANNAMAAGYTCEDLIEYTSCNPGYHLSKSCPDGYMFASGVCAYDEGDSSFEIGHTVDSCAEIDMYIFKGDICVKEEYIEDAGWGYWQSDFVDTTSDVFSCELCPAGASCAGGDAPMKKCAAGTYQSETGQSSCIPAPAGNMAQTTATVLIGAINYQACAAGTYQPSTGQTSCRSCPAGSYCETAGLSAVTGECAVGSFAYAGAASCLSCPSTGLNDANGNPVAGTTVGTGASSLTECVVGSNISFKDDKGIYRFTSNCAFDSKLDYYTPEEEMGGGYVSCKTGYQRAGSEGEYCIEKIPEWKCMEIGGAAYWNATTNTCVCDNEPGPYWDFDPNSGNITCQSH